MDISERIREIISAALEIDARQLTEESTWLDINADSLDIVEIIMSLEDSFGIEITDEELEGLHSLGELITLIENKC